MSIFVHWFMCHSQARRFMLSAQSSFHSSAQLQSTTPTDVAVEMEHATGPERWICISLLPMLQRIPTVVVARYPASGSCLSLSPFISLSLPLPSICLSLSSVLSSSAAFRIGLTSCMVLVGRSWSRRRRASIPGTRIGDYLDLIRPDPVHDTVQFLLCFYDCLLSTDFWLVGWMLHLAQQRIQ